MARIRSPVDLRDIDWVDAAAAVAAAALVAALVRLWLHTSGFIDSDTYEVLDGTGRIAACLRDDSYPCGAAVNEFAVLQYLPAFALKELGASYDEAAHGLIRLNGVCFLGLLALALPLARALASRTAGVVYAIAVLTSPALWYAHAAQGEMLAALALTTMTIAVLAGWSWPILGAATFAAVISKETALPFVLIVVFAAVQARRLRRSDGLSRSHLGAVAAGSALGIVANVGFNLFRYGTIGNEDYLRAELHVPAVQVAKNAAALIVAPTGGLVWFWPVALAIILAAAVLAVRGVDSFRAALGEPVLVSMAGLGGLLLVFSLWYSPYGGAAWGPRLLLPWMPALVVIALAGAPGVVRAVELALTARRLVLVWGALALVGLPHLGSIMNASRYWHAYPGVAGAADEVAVMPFYGDRACPRYPVIEDGRSYYFRCLNHQTWDRGLAVSRGLGATGDGSRLLVLAYVATLGGLLAAARRGARRQSANS